MINDKTSSIIKNVVKNNVSSLGLPLVNVQILKNYILRVTINRFDNKITTIEDCKIVHEHFIFA